MCTLDDLSPDNTRSSLFRNLTHVPYTPSQTGSPDFVCQIIDTYTNRNYSMHRFIVYHRKWKCYFQIMFYLLCLSLCFPKTITTGWFEDVHLICQEIKLANIFTKISENIKETHTKMPAVTYAMAMAVTAVRSIIFGFHFYSYQLSRAC